MDNSAVSQQTYEKQLIFHLLIFLKAMEQYHRWGEQALLSDRLRQDPQLVIGLRELLKVIGACGQRFQSLPEPPEQALAADRHIRAMGKALGLFAQNLEQLLLTSDRHQRKRISANLALQSQVVKQGCHRFVTLYEQAYPGRLSGALQQMNERLPLELIGAASNDYRC